MHTAESDLVIKSSHADIPKFNSMLYFQDKSEIGKIDEIFGPINEVVSLPNYLALLILHPFDSTLN